MFSSEPKWAEKTEWRGEGALINEKTKKKQANKQMGGWACKQTQESKKWVIQSQETRSKVNKHWGMETVTKADDLTPSRVQGLVKVLAGKMRNWEQTWGREA